MADYVRAATALLGSIGFAGEATTGFDCTGCSALLIYVAWADLTNFDAPLVSIGGQYAKPLLAPRRQDGDAADYQGAQMVFVLPAPPSGAQTITVHGTQFMGDTEIAVVGLAGALGQIGASGSAHYAGDLAKTVDLAAVAAGSQVVGFAITRYVAQPADLTPSVGAARSHTNGGDGTTAVWCFAGAAPGAGDLAYTVTADPWLYGSLVVLEVYDAGHVVDHPVTVTAAQVDYLGTAEEDAPLVSTFDPEGADAVLVAVIASNQSATPPLRINGAPRAVQVLKEQQTDAGTIWWTVIPAPDGPLEGALPFTPGYFGVSAMAWVGLAGLSGVAPHRWTAHAMSGEDPGGVGLKLATASDPASRLVTIAASVFTSSDLIPNHEWALQASDQGPSIKAWAFTALGGSAMAFEGVMPSYANLQLLTVEFAKGLDVAPYYQATLAGVAPAPMMAAAGTVADPVASGQQLGVYWESFLDLPALPNPRKQDFALYGVPAHIDEVYLSFASPKCSYAALSDNGKATTGLEWDRPLQLLADIISDIKARQATRFYLAVQQWPQASGINEPGSADGWGGMDAGDVAAMRALCDDLGLAGVVIDYELFSRLLSRDFSFSGPLAAGQTVHFHMHGLLWRPDWSGQDPVTVDVSTPYATSSAATEAAFVADITAAFAALVIPQIDCALEPSGAIRVRYDYVLSLDDITVSVTGPGAPSVTMVDSSLEYHCRADPDHPGQRICYTDSELLQVIETMRAGLPRPDYEVWLDTTGNGFYGEAPYLPERTGGTFGWNHSYDMVLTRPENAATLAALDGVHIMAYDIGDGFDPRQALKAALAYLPDSKVYLGLRVGPPDYANVTTSLSQMQDYTNHVLTAGAHGLFFYALLWDRIDHRGNFGLTNPDINLGAWGVATRLGHTVRRRAIAQDTPQATPLMF